MSDKDIQSQLDELKEKFESVESSIQHKSSPAKLKAERKYYSTLTPFSLRFNKNEDELWEHLNKQSNKSKYLKTLIAKDMCYVNWAHFSGCVPTKELKRQWDEFKQVRYNYKKYDRWDSISDLISFIDNNKITVRLWTEIERLFYFDDEITDIACQALIIGALPKDAWTKEVLTSKIDDYFAYVDINLNANWDKFTLIELKSKFLKKSFLVAEDSKIDINIDFYRLDIDAIMKHFNIKDVDIEELLKNKKKEIRQINSFWDNKLIQYDW